VFIYTQQGENSAGKDSFRRKLPYDIDGRAKTNPKFFVWFGRKLAYVWNEGLQPILKHAWYPVPSTNGMGSAVIPKCFRSTFRISCIRFSTFGQTTPVFAPFRMMPFSSAIARRVTHAWLGFPFLLSAKPSSA
jgi:hypothetical protein